MDIKSTNLTWAISRRPKKAKVVTKNKSRELLILHPSEDWGSKGGRQAQWVTTIPQLLRVDAQQTGSFSGCQAMLSKLYGMGGRDTECILSQ